MAKVETDLETTIEPAAVRAALLDFTERRPEIWPGIEPSLYEVISVDETSALIKEGSRMPGMRVWAKEEYDWSNPDVIRWTVRESNFCAPGSFVSAAIAPSPTGGSRIHIVWSRTPTTLGARLMFVGIALSRGAPIKASFAAGMKRLTEAQAGAAPAH